MSPRSVVLWLGLLVGVPTAAAAQAQTDIDPVAASPDKFTVILENEHVRVIEYVLAPGDRDDWHTHPPKVSYIISSGMLQITREDGTSFLSEEKAGSAVWMGRLGRHYAENVGDSEVRVLLVEVKAAEGGISTVPANKR